MTAVLSIRDLRVVFDTDHGPVAALEGVDLDVAPGEIVALVGESGSGKTVTGKAVLGLLPESAIVSGSIRLRDGDGDVEIVGAPERTMRRLRGAAAAMVFQEPSTALNPVFTVGWQIVEGIRAHTSLGRRAARAEAVRVLRTVGIPDPEKRIDDYPHQFSGGQKQRIVIAMALIQGAPLIVADEPTTALDVTVQAEILQLLRTLRHDLGGSMLLITHNMGVVADLADRVIVMNGGRIVESADVQSLFADPQHEYTRSLLAAVPRIGAGDAGEPAAVPEPSAEAPLVAAEHLEIVYPGRMGRPSFTAIADLSLSLASGEVLGLVGESGSGKTTLARAIAGLVPATGGSLSVLGAELVGRRAGLGAAARADLGFVFQDPATSFNPFLTIGECIAEPFVIHGRAESTAAVRAEVHELLDAVRLPRGFADRFPHELSGGQRQRASLARAIALRPRLLIADEPTSALDVSVQATVLDLFAELQSALGFGCLFVSHDLAVVDRIAGRVVVLRQGAIVEQGPTREVLRAPREAYTRKLLASLPVPDPVLQRAAREALAAAG
ncbi:ABC transporter ATP-binding protein [Rathayibacter sp. VKM Ac-2835]|uniref:dipeptide ABC transporter ATP-binding protein n=1 Tax=Rathayibacter sp. VKM Ac-2835 TaxID=2739043 RepID=UPI001566D8A8|nr:ABC transporter ATP-binding protein [Rathayibacter sp. VKM Ac-2835]NRG42390.1 ABC transporter ATP-binding protein [Rathayibacter sp. VKM Ac-2835]